MEWLVFSLRWNICLHRWKRRRRRMIRYSCLTFRFRCGCMEVKELQMSSEKVGFQPLWKLYHRFALQRTWKMIQQQDHHSEARKPFSMADLYIWCGHIPSLLLRKSCLNKHYCKLFLVEYDLNHRTTSIKSQVCHLHQHR